MRDTSTSPLDAVKPLLRVRQMREFTDEPVREDDIDAIVDAARWSGSSSNSQPWRFIVLRDRNQVRRLGEMALPQTRGALTAAAAVAIVIPDDSERAVSYAFDEGRAAERMLVAATMLGLGAGLSWILPDKTEVVGQALSLPRGRKIRTLVSIGHPSAGALAPKSEKGKARLPRDEVVFEGRWPASK